MLDLSTTYLGLKLRNPLVAAASPLSKSVEKVRALEQAGVAAIVMYSLFEEQVLHGSPDPDSLLARGTTAPYEALSYFPAAAAYSGGAEQYLERIVQLKQAVSIPIIASLNGVSSGAWTSIAQQIEQAGADALELNLYYLPTDTELTSAQMEESYVELVKAIHSQVSIPLAVKLSPYITALPNLASRLVRAGARGLVLFNRFYQPDFDPETLDLVPNLVFSDSADMRLPLRWIAMLYDHIGADFALSTGVHTALDLIKAVMAGASVATVASTLLRYGPSRATDLLSEAEEWMQAHGYESFFRMRGLITAQTGNDAAAAERANYIKTIGSYNNPAHFERHPARRGLVWSADDPTQGGMIVS